MCQPYSIRLDFEKSTHSLQLENGCHERKEKLKTNFSNIFWSGIDED